MCGTHEQPHIHMHIHAYIYIVNWLPINAIKAGAAFHVILFPLDILWETRPVTLLQDRNTYFTNWYWVGYIESMVRATEGTHRKKGSTAF